MPQLGARRVEYNKVLMSVAEIEKGVVPANAKLTGNQPDDSLISENKQVGTKCGFATLLGPSNSGKSTLVNYLVGYKVAIVTPKVQTTRCRISGIATRSDTQIIFLDTPGIFEPTGRLSRAMVKSAWKSSRDGDVVALVLDAFKLQKCFSKQSRQRQRENRDYVEGNSDEKEVLDRVDDDDVEPNEFKIPSDIQKVLEGLQVARQRGRATKLCVCTNKMDTVRPALHDRLLGDVKRMLDRYDLDSDTIPIFPISAKTGTFQMKAFEDWVIEHMPRGPWLYEDDDMTDMPARQLAAEVTREKAFMLLRQELPYEIAVDTTSYKERDDGSIRITQDILVGRDSQKRIVTGPGGGVVKEIGCRSRAELGDILGTTVHLMLTVKVRRHWKDEKWQYQQWGLDFNA